MLTWKLQLTRNSIKKLAILSFQFVMLSGLTLNSVKILLLPLCLFVQFNSFSSNLWFMLFVLNPFHVDHLFPVFNMLRYQYYIISLCYQTKMLTFGKLEQSSNWIRIKSNCFSQFGVVQWKFQCGAPSLKRRITKSVVLFAVRCTNNGLSCGVSTKWLGQSHGTLVVLGTALALTIQTEAERLISVSSFLSTCRLSKRWMWSLSNCTSS